MRSDPRRRMLRNPIRKPRLQLFECRDDRLRVTQPRQAAACRAEPLESLSRRSVAHPVKQCGHSLDFLDALASSMDITLGPRALKEPLRRSTKFLACDASKLAADRLSR